MRNVIGIIFGVVIGGFILAGILWWLFVVAAVVAVAGFAWRVARGDAKALIGRRSSAGGGWCSCR